MQRLLLRGLTPPARIQYFLVNHSHSILLSELLAFNSSQWITRLTLPSSSIIVPEQANSFLT